MSSRSWASRMPLPAVHGCQCLPAVLRLGLTIVPALPHPAASRSLVWTGSQRAGLGRIAVWAWDKVKQHRSCGETLAGGVQPPEAPVPGGPPSYKVRAWAEPGVIPKATCPLGACS